MAVARDCGAWRGSRRGSPVSARAVLTGRRISGRSPVQGGGDLLGPDGRSGCLPLVGAGRYRYLGRQPCGQAACGRGRSGLVLRRHSRGGARLGVRSGWSGGISDATAGARGSRAGAREGRQPFGNLLSRQNALGLYHDHELRRYGLSCKRNERAWVCGERELQRRKAADIPKRQSW